MYKTEFCFEWKIENFSFCPEENGQCLWSPNFVFRWVDNYFHGSLCLYPRGNEKENENFLTCALYGFVKDSSYFTRVCRFEIIGASGQILQSLEEDAILKTTNSNIALITKLIFVEEYLKDLECSAEDSLTIRCILGQRNSDKSEFKHIIGTTKVGVTRESFETVIFTEERNEIPAKYIKDFRLSIRERQGKLVVSVSRPMSKDNKACFVESSLTMLSRVEYGKFTFKANHFFSSSSNCWEFPLTTLSRELQSKRNDYIISDSNDTWIRFYWEFSYSNRSILTLLTPEMQSPILMDKTDFSSDEICSTLQDDLRILLDSKNLCDVELKVGDQVLHAHKLVLVARSPVFSSMFNNDMSETQTGIVDIVDTNVHILKLFLKFLYTDTVEELSYEVAKGMLLMAEKYQVPSLKKKCVKFLEKQISVENVCDMLTLAEAVNHAKLKTSSIDFIIANSADILSSPLWFVWMKNNMELATTILSQLSLNMLSSKN